MSLSPRTPGPDGELECPPPIACFCGRRIFDGEAIRSRCVVLYGGGAKALCRCKRWVMLPLRWVGGGDDTDADAGG